MHLTTQKGTTVPCISIFHIMLSKHLLHQQMSSEMAFRSSWTARRSKRLPTSSRHSKKPSRPTKHSATGKKAFIQKQSQYLLDAACSEGLIRASERATYEARFAEDFDAATAALEALRSDQKEQLTSDTEQASTSSADELKNDIQKLLGCKTQQGPSELLEALKETLSAYEALRDWKKSFIQKQSQRLLATACSEGLIRASEQATYEARFTKDFDAAAAALEALRSERQKQSNSRASMAHFLGSISSTVPRSTSMEQFTSPEASLYLQLLKNEPSRLKELQQQEPTTYRQLLEAHLAWKRHRLDVEQTKRTQHAQAYAS